MTLHTWNKSLDAGAARLHACLRMLAPGDSLLLLEDGVYAALQLESGMPLRALIAGNVALHVLAPDLAARGLSARIPRGITEVEYADFVQMCLTHGRVVNWN